MKLNNKTLKKAFDHLSDDLCMRYLIDNFCNDIDIYERYESNYAKALSFLVIEQQVSFKAAITIKNRFSKIINDLSDKDIIDMDEKKIQKVGISFKKVEYIKNVYLYFKDSKFNFSDSSDQDVINELTNIKGIGLWSAQMFLIFVLMRINIFSKGDLALMNSIKVNYSLDINDSEKVDSLIKTWSPFKSVASLLLWKSIEERYYYS